MEITARSFWTLVHGMGFGALYLLAFSGAIALLCLHSSSNAHAHSATRSDRVLGIYLTVMAALAWLTVLSGTYIVYPWHRATLPLAWPISQPFRARFYCRIRRQNSGTRSEWSGKSTLPGWRR